jgi:hypothetical protein
MEEVRPGDQPLPVPNDSPDIQSMVIADIEARRQVGIERYGTALQAGNGRDALRDAYEEALDLACYLRQAIAEREQQPMIRVGYPQPMTEEQAAEFRRQFAETVKRNPGWLVNS